jgi:hypothetical protein
MHFTLAAMSRIRKFVLRVHHGHRWTSPDLNAQGALAELPLEIEQGFD